MDYIDPAVYPDTTRKGYLLKDLVKNFQQVLGEAGPIAIGKLMHYTSDLIGSSGFELWKKLCWDYAYDHIGTASPRIFYYLRKKFAELGEKNAKLNLDQFCRNQEVQETVMECVLILQMCPKKTKVKYPAVPQETIGNTDWLRGTLRTTDKACVRKVYQHNTDQEQMLHAANELIYSIQANEEQTALFWVKWLLLEEASVMKQYGSNLSTNPRGGAGNKNPTQVGYYIIAVLAELYKEYHSKNMIRMSEEVQAIINIYRDSTTSHKHKMDIMAIMVQLLIITPRLKVPAAPSLVQDPGTLQRILQSAPQFFEEILKYPPVKPLPIKVTGLKAKKVKDKSKESELEQRLAAIDAATMNFYKM